MSVYINFVSRHLSSGVVLSYTLFLGIICGSVKSTFINNLGLLMCMSHLLTKSKYILGLECPRHFWMMFNQKEKARKPTMTEEFRFKEGEKIGELARTLFADGI